MDAVAQGTEERFLVYAMDKRYETIGPFFSWLKLDRRRTTSCISAPSFSKEILACWAFTVCFAIPTFIFLIS